jgi:hypothetical protein
LVAEKDTWRDLDNTQSFWKSFFDASDIGHDDHFMDWKITLTDMDLNRSQALQPFNATAQQQANYSASSTLLLPMVSTEPFHALKKPNIPGH